MAGKISHPGIVTVYQLGEEDENIFIVMEYVEGSLPSYNWTRVLFDRHKTPLTRRFVSIMAPPFAVSDGPRFNHAWLGRRQQSTRQRATPRLILPN